MRMARFVTVDSNVMSISQGSTAMRRLYLYSTFEYKNQTITLLPCGYMQNLLIWVTTYPDLIELILDSFYVDDLTTGADS